MMQYETENFEKQLSKELKQYVNTFVKKLFHFKERESFSRIKQSLTYSDFCDTKSGTYFKVGTLEQLKNRLDFLNDDEIKIVYELKKLLSSLSRSRDLARFIVNNNSDLTLNTEKRIWYVERKSATNKKVSKKELSEIERRYQVAKLVLKKDKNKKAKDKKKK